MTQDESYPDYFTFACSGRQFDANFGIVGIGQDLSVSEGCDGSPRFVSCGPDLNDGMTQAERAELADFMIARWQAFRAAASTQEQKT